MARGKRVVIKRGILDKGSGSFDNMEVTIKNVIRPEKGSDKGKTKKRKAN